MPKAPVTRRLRGAARMQQQGRRQVQLWLTPVEVSMVRAAFPRCALATIAKNVLLRRCEEAGQYRYLHEQKRHASPKRPG